MSEGRARAKMIIKLIKREMESVHVWVEKGGGGASGEDKIAVANSRAAVDIARGDTRIYIFARAREANYDFIG